MEIVCLNMSCTLFTWIGKIPMLKRKTSTICVKKTSFLFSFFQKVIRHVDLSFRTTAGCSKLFEFIDKKYGYVTPVQVASRNPAFITFKLTSRLRIDWVGVHITHSNIIKRLQLFFC